MADIRQSRQTRGGIFHHRPPVLVDLRRYVTANRCATACSCRQFWLLRRFKWLSLSLDASPVREALQTSMPCALPVTLLALTNELILPCIGFQSPKVNHETKQVRNVYHELYSHGGPLVPRSSLPLSCPYSPHLTTHVGFAVLPFRTPPSSPVPVYGLSAYVLCPRTEW